MHCFDTETQRWKPLLTSMAPLPRKGHTIVPVRKNKEILLLLLGGAPSGGSSLRMDMEVAMTKHAELETGRAVWQRQRVAGNPPLPRHGHTCTVVDRRRLVVFGGASAHDETLLNDLHVLDFE